MGLSCRWRGSCGCREWWSVAAEFEHGERDHGVGGVEAVGAAADQADGGVYGFGASVGEAVAKRRDDAVAVAVDGGGCLREAGQAAGLRPRDPDVEALGSKLPVRLVEDGSQLFFEQVGAVQRLVSVGDLLERRGLAIGQMLGVLPKRPARVFEPPGAFGIAVTASLVSYLAADGV